jgi:serine/threonine protein kinase
LPAATPSRANLQHPHILSLHDSGEVDGTVFYVMPFVDGESLRDRLTRERQLPIEVAVAIATEVADALRYAHDHGVIHRDIKPENILLHGGHALVMDFGIALAATTSPMPSSMPSRVVARPRRRSVTPSPALATRRPSRRRSPRHARCRSTGSCWPSPSCAGCPSPGWTRGPGGTTAASPRDCCSSRPLRLARRVRGARGAGRSASGSGFRRSRACARPGPDRSRCCSSSGSRSPVRSPVRSRGGSFAAPNRAAGSQARAADRRARRSSRSRIS